MAALFRSLSISRLDGGVVDASAWSGIELDVFGNGEEYGVHLRTDALTRPWQSYRQIFTATRSGGRFSCRSTTLFPIARMFCSILIGCGGLAWSPLAAPSQPILPSVVCGS